VKQVVALVAVQAQGSGEGGQGLAEGCTPFFALPRSSSV